MTYGKYNRRKWKVRSSNSPECPRKTIVTFDGPQSAVTVHCGNLTPYGTGTYNPSSDTITMPNEYEISMTEGSPRKITFTRQSGQGGLSTRDTGSWTAEDNGPWPGEDEV